MYKTKFKIIVNQLTLFLGNVKKKPSKLMRKLHR